MQIHLEIHKNEAWIREQYEEYKAHGMCVNIKGECRDCAAFLINPKKTAGYCNELYTTFELGFWCKNWVEREAEDVEQ